jgi:hypothetical protein
MSDVDVKLARRPDDLLFSRLGRLTLLLAAGPGQPQPKPWDVERIATYDFFADNPLLVFGPDTAQRKCVLIAGFDAENLSYHSAAQRFSNRRARLQNDLAQLLARRLIAAHLDGKRVVYELTDAGQRLAGTFSSVYAEGYRVSAALVAKELNRLSATALRERTASMLRAEHFLLDVQLEEEVAV